MRKTILLAALCATMAVGHAGHAQEAGFSDGEDDAYVTDGSLSAYKPPNPLLSDPNADILAAGYTSRARSKGQPSYTATITIKSVAQTGYNYVVAGRFGEDCQLYHFLSPGHTVRANAWCGTVGVDRRLIGSIEGTATSQDGNTLSVTYRYRPSRLPAELAADTELGPLFAYTCTRQGTDHGCDYGVTDYAAGGDQVFRI